MKFSLQILAFSCLMLVSPWAMHGADKAGLENDKSLEVAQQESKRNADSKTSLNHKEVDPKTPEYVYIDTLFELVRTGNSAQIIKWVQKLENLGIDFTDFEEINGDNVLHIAVRRGDPEIITTLLKLDTEDTLRFNRNCKREVPSQIVKTMLRALDKSKRVHRENLENIFGLVYVSPALLKEHVALLLEERALENKKLALSERRLALEKNSVTSKNEKKKE